MPRGIPGSGKAALRKPATGGAVTEAPASATSTTVAPVREQIKQMTGFQNLDELKAAVPESTVGPAEPKKERKKRTLVDAADTDPLMSDPKYREAIGNMTAFGGKKVVSSGFSVAASALKDERLKLQPEEEKVWDEYFYVVSKRSNFDPTSPWFLAVYALVMIFTQIGARMWERSGYKGLFAIMEKLSPQPLKKAPEGLHKDGARTEFAS